VQSVEWATALGFDTAAFARRFGAPTQPPRRVMRVVVWIRPPSLGASARLLNHRA